MRARKICARRLGRISRTISNQRSGPLSRPPHGGPVLFRIHNVGTHGQLQSGLNVVARVEEVAVLEQEDASTLGNHIHTPVHAPVEERGCPALEWLRAIFAIDIVEVQVEGEVRPFRAIECLIGAIAMRCCC
jgi:hypothetical protein